MKNALFLLTGTLLLMMSCVKKDPDCIKYPEPMEVFSGITVGETDTNVVYLYVDSSNFSRSSRLLYPAWSCKVKDYILIEKESESEGLSHGAYYRISSNTPRLKFCVATYTDSIFLKEYVTTWPTKQDSVQEFTTYPQSGATLFSAEPISYVKTFEEGDLIGEGENFEDGPINIFRKGYKSELTSHGSQDGVHIFNKKIYDLESGYPELEEDFYLGFRYHTGGNAMQYGYVHLTVTNSESAPLEVILHDFGINR